MLLARSIADLLLFASVLFLPWWITLIMGAGLFFYFPAYFAELLAVALFMDVLYGTGTTKFSFSLVSTLSAVLLILILSPVKRRMRLG